MAAKPLPYVLGELHELTLDPSAEVLQFEKDNVTYETRGYTHSRYNATVTFTIDPVTKAPITIQRIEILPTLYKPVNIVAIKPVTSIPTTISIGFNMYRGYITYSVNII